MAKTVKIVTLVSQQLLISEIAEIAAVVPGEPDCKLIKPFIIKENNEMKIMVRPLNKWNRNQIIRTIDKLWKPGNKSLDVEICMICHEDMVEDTPTIQTLTQLLYHEVCQHLEQR